jgi:hypothetical protein
MTHTAFCGGKNQDFAACLIKRGKYGLIKYIKYMGGSGNCIYRTGPNYAMKLLASVVIIGSSVVMPHRQYRLNSSHSIPLSLF